ncbi:hypothetical protein M2324_001925 [Rhodovulum sulfidophilum]|nr:hypothetical protein [Rhodovulum sulfidophilum]
MAARNRPSSICVWAAGGSDLTVDADVLAVRAGAARSGQVDGIGVTVTTRPSRVV